MKNRLYLLLALAVSTSLFGAASSSELYLPEQPSADDIKGVKALITGAALTSLSDEQIQASWTAVNKELKRLMAGYFGWTLFKALNDTTPTARGNISILLDTLTKRIDRAQESSIIDNIGRTAVGIYLNQQNNLKPSIYLIPNALQKNSGNYEAVHLILNARDRSDDAKLKIAILAKTSSEDYAFPLNMLAALISTGLFANDLNNEDTKQLFLRTSNDIVTATEEMRKIQRQTGILASTPPAYYDLRNIEIAKLLNPLLPADKQFPAAQLGEAAQEVPATGGAQTSAGTSQPQQGETSAGTSQPTGEPSEARKQQLNINSVSDLISGIYVVPTDQTMRMTPDEIAYYLFDSGIVKPTNVTDRSHADWTLLHALAGSYAGDLVDLIKRFVEEYKPDPTVPASKDKLKPLDLAKVKGKTKDKSKTISYLQQLETQAQAKRAQKEAKAEAERTQRAAKKQAEQDTVRAQIERFVTQAVNAELTGDSRLNQTALQTARTAAEAVDLDVNKEVTSLYVNMLEKKRAEKEASEKAASLEAERIAAEAEAEERLKQQEANQEIGRIAPLLERAVQAHRGGVSDTDNQSLQDALEIAKKYNLGEDNVKQDFVNLLKQPAPATQQGPGESSSGGAVQTPQGPLSEDRKRKLDIKSIPDLIARIVTGTGAQEMSYDEVQHYLFGAGIVNEKNAMQNNGAGATLVSALAYAAPEKGYAPLVQSFIERYNPTISDKQLESYIKVAQKQNNNGIAQYLQTLLDEQKARQQQAEPSEPQQAEPKTLAELIELIDSDTLTDGQQILAYTKQLVNKRNVNSTPSGLGQTIMHAIAGTQGDFADVMKHLLTIGGKPSEKNVSGETVSDATLQANTKIKDILEQWQQQQPGTSAGQEQEEATPGKAEPSEPQTTNEQAAILIPWMNSITQAQLDNDTNKLALLARQGVDIAEKANLSGEDVGALYDRAVAVAKPEGQISKLLDEAVELNLKGDSKKGGQKIAEAVRRASGIQLTKQDVLAMFQSKLDAAKQTQQQKPTKGATPSAGAITTVADVTNVWRAAKRGATLTPDQVEQLIELADTPETARRTDKQKAAAWRKAVQMIRSLGDKGIEGIADINIREDWQSYYR